MDELNFAVHILRAEVHVGGVIEHHRAHFEQPREEGSHAPKLVLAPVLVRMVMALRAVQAASKEDANLFGHHIGRRTDLVVGKEVAGGRSISLRREAFAGDFVVRPVGLDAGANPLPVFLAPLRRQSVGEDGDAEDVGEAESPVVDKLGRSE